jgi:hypothetical protein
LGSFYIALKSVFCFHKIREQKGRTSPAEGCVSVCGGSRGKGTGVLNMAQILCTYGKTRPVETITIPRMRRGGIKENDGVDKFKLDML